MFAADHAFTPTAHVSAAATFRNPIAPGADPWVIRHEGYYYWCASERDLGVAVYRSRSLTTMGDKFVVWRAPAKGDYCAQVWAPELHRLDGKWYIYTAASDGRNETHRAIVLEGSGDDPTQPFVFKAELYTGDDTPRRRRNRWAIDATILEHEGARYCLWSGWRDDRDEQWLYISAMANPWTLSGPRVRLCANNDYLWEHVAEDAAERGLNEGPQALRRDGRVFVVYSCSGSWETTYKLGLLELAPGGNPLDPSAWRKHAAPVFQATARTYGVGHCSFVSSPDGTEDWIVYHAKTSRAHGWQRVIMAQPFTWDSEGRPRFGAPLDAGVAVEIPSGETVRPARDPLRPARGLVEGVRVVKKSDEAQGEPLALN